ncbi:hypothetical protein BDN72DRAFT_845178 [Pluteus cervinus]|uniref:Uncharacterized protein n=1 Tax=Pluteus cervinus TaxID=181527 RepID=A0ACD3AIZ3_9AGAR|nr:hypothetical protein BDN72DRAFT_845178 [Pluteus cervinus]
MFEVGEMVRGEGAAGCGGGGGGGGDGGGGEGYIRCCPRPRSPSRIQIPIATPSLPHKFLHLSVRSFVPLGMIWIRRRVELNGCMCVDYKEEELDSVINRFGSGIVGVSEFRLRIGRWRCLSLGAVTSHGGKREGRVVVGVRVWVFRAP